MKRRTFIGTLCAALVAPFAWGKQQYEMLPTLYYKHDPWCGTPNCTLQFHKRNIECNEFLTSNMHISNKFVNDREPFYWLDSPLTKESMNTLAVQFTLKGKDYAMGTILGESGVWNDKWKVEALFDAGKCTALDLLKLREVL